MPAVPPSPRRQAPWWQWACLAALVIVVYLPVLGADFVNWDDDNHVLDQPCVTDPHGLWRCWAEPWWAGYYPLTWSSFHLEWQLSGGAPWLFHLDNVLLHAANTVLVGRLAGSLGVPPAASVLVAALWALHPMQVASVAWVTERKNTLYVCLWLGALLVYLHRTDTKPERRLPARALSLVLFVAALASKNAAAATLPAAIVLLEWARGRPLDRRLAADLIPYLSLALAAGIIQVAWLPADVGTPPLGIRIGLAARALWFYVVKFVWPTKLLPIYPRWSTDGIGATEYVSLAGVAALASAVAALRLRIPRGVLVGLAHFLVNVAPVVGIVWFTFFHHSLVSDHFAYLPSLGLVLVAVVGVRAVVHAMALPDHTATAALAAWCVALGVLTWRQIPVWHDSVTFWTYNRERNPRCFACAFNFGNARLAQGRLDEAEMLYEEAIRLEPSDERPLYNLGNVLTQKGRLADAIARYREALLLDPDSVTIHNNLGVALAREGQTAEAEAEFQQALGFAPDDPEAHVNLGEIAAHRGDWATAMSHYETVLRKDPRRVEVVDSLAAALSAAGRVGDAVRVLRDGLARSPRAPKLGGSLAWILATAREARWRDGAEATRLAEEACALTGYRDPDLLDTLAAAYAEAGRFEDALRTARRALEVAAPDSDLAGSIPRRIAVYEAGQPYREE